jgi:topoisomerase IV subunit B
MVKFHRDGEVKEAEFSKGILVARRKVKATEENGTHVEFKPDSNIFKKLPLHHDYVSAMMKNYTFLNAGLVLEFNGEKFHSKNGLLDLLNENMDSRPFIRLFT